jgi:polyisoprenoid-binding protein YceI
VCAETARTSSWPVELSFEYAGVTPDPWGGTRIGFSAKGEINRRDFNVNFEGMQNGLAVVTDKVSLVIDVEAKLRQDAPAE